MESEKTRRTNLLLIAGFTVAALIIGLIIYVASSSNRTSSSNDEKQTVVKDKTSGEELIESDNKDEETVGKNPNAPLLVGFGQLLELGVTSDDTQFIKQSVTDYILGDTAFPAKSKVSFDRKTFSQKINDDFTNDYFFSIVVNDKQRYGFLVHTDSLSTITLTIKDSAGKQVFTR